MKYLLLYTLLLFGIHIQASKGRLQPLLKKNFIQKASKFLQKKNKKAFWEYVKHAYQNYEFPMVTFINDLKKEQKYMVQNRCKKYRKKKLLSGEQLAILQRIETYIKKDVEYKKQKKMSTKDT